ncbi:MAG TPA: hypothetical protein VKZ96_04045 [Thermomicrobiales bacterium]|nr:hypothetical protein [Thermomicrobiales bacterium]
MEEPGANLSTTSGRLAGAPGTTSMGPPRSLSGTTSLLQRWGTPESDQRYVAETLDWIAGELGAKRPRFVRLLPSGIWIVQTVVQGKIVAQAADRAEIAMAWTVALGREVYSAARPRVTTFDGSGIRPIAVTSYIGIPVTCQEGIAGVIEAAGELRPDAERNARAAGGRLGEFATRLMFDPGLRAAPRITLETECEISSGLGTPSYGVLSRDEWNFLTNLHGAMTLQELADAAGFDGEQVIDLARALASRGLITLRTPTGVLMTSTTSLLSELPTEQSTV